MYRKLTMVCAAWIALAALASSSSSQDPPKTEAVVRTGSVVSFDYTVKDETGTVIDSSAGKSPMKYTHGTGQIIRGLESQLAGMKTGGEKKVTVKPEDGYGVVDPGAFQEIPKDKLPPDALKIGTMLMAQGPQGQNVPVRVHEIKENTVVMDFNHPLAGKTLSFEVKITDIKPAEK